MRASRRGRSRSARKANAMLDLYAVKTQIDSMVADERRVQEDFRAKLELALAEYRRWLPEWGALGPQDRREPHLLAVARLGRGPRRWDRRARSPEHH